MLLLRATILPISSSLLFCVFFSFLRFRILFRLVPVVAVAMNRAIAFAYLLLGELEGDSIKLQYFIN